ncbi:ATP-binding protein [Aliiroseovarius sp.]|uniref:ATP-binding protein n=1 Tax=Aliiroseovarius sp. TaxID=1872442 RepID=UPI0026196C68|nr:ATP-binding protein [Aliiroseovarius sp.]
MTQMQRVHLVFPGTQLSVRKALKSCMQGLTHLEMSQDDKSSVELVLAEVLNNVVKHAYQEHDIGVIELDVTRQGDALKVTLLDDGIPMPGGKMPDGLPHDLNVLGEQDLPEGGFGWFLIRELTHDLTYCRDGNRNQLSFRMDLRGAPLPN